TSAFRRAKWRHPPGSSCCFEMTTKNWKFPLRLHNQFLGRRTQMKRHFSSRGEALAELTAARMLVKRQKIENSVMRSPRFRAHGTQWSPTVPRLPRSNKPHAATSKENDVMFH